MPDKTTPYRPVDDVDEEDIGKESLDCVSMEEADKQSLDLSEFTMQPQLRSIPARKRNWLRLVINIVPLLLVTAGVIGLFVQVFSTRTATARKDAAKEQLTSESGGLKVAFATLLSISDDKHAHEASIYDDNYFVATRMLGYQLLHDSVTKNRLGAPLIVITTPNVSQAKIDRLQRDGLTVFPVTEPIEPPLYQTYHHGRYKDVFSKLLIWKWTQYDRVIFVDNDHVLVKSLDGIIHETQTQPFSNLKQESNIAADEAAQPEDYIFAPIGEIKVGHHFPPTKEEMEGGKFGAEYPNAGFFVIKPDLSMWDYMMSVLATPNKLSAIYPEQNLFDYIFRPKGNMPWKMLDIKSSVHRPSMQEVHNGAHALHEKFWNIYLNNAELADWLKSWRWRMEGFYTAWDNYMQH